MLVYLEYCLAHLHKIHLESLGKFRKETNGSIQYSKVLLKPNGTFNMFDEWRNVVTINSPSSSTKKNPFTRHSTKRTLLQIILRRPLGAANENTNVLAEESAA